MTHRFAICIKNNGYEASLELRKLYEVLPDQRATQLGQIRVIDESGEDYQYPEDFFLPITLPELLQRAVLHAT
jgi:hypothetical protein